MEAYEASKAVNSAERYMLALVLGVFTAIFFNIIVTGLLSVSEKSITLLVGVVIAYQTVYAAINMVVTVMFVLMARDLVSLARLAIDDVVSRNPPTPPRRPYKVYLYTVLPGILFGSLGAVLMNLPGILGGSKGFNMYSFIGGLSAVTGAALFLIAGYVIINTMDAVASRLGIPSVSWLGGLVALKYLVSLVGIIPGVTSIVFFFMFLLLVVELLLLYDIKNVVKKKFGLTESSATMP